MYYKKEFLADICISLYSKLDKNHIKFGLKRENYNCVHDDSEYNLLILDYLFHLYSSSPK